MTAKQKKVREVSLWVLYGMDVADHLVDEAIEGFYPIAHDLEPDAHEMWHQVEERVGDVVERRPQIDEWIQEVSPRWRVGRMAVIDRNLLRLGVWELFTLDTPPIVVINACVELAKEYGEQSTPAFVNGLLDQICTDHDIEVDQSR
ncbi:MAG: transcription antitermination factor NusB [Persicimonas sp.]